MRRVSPKPLLLTLLLLFTRQLTLAADLQAAETERPAPRFAAPKQLCTLANKDISESSGLAVSRRFQGVFWTHNDSGGAPQIFAFDANGKSLGITKLRKAKAVDWEDMGSFVLDGIPYLFVADVGDNQSRRKKCVIYVAIEPRQLGKPTLAEAVEFKYEDGPRDCEGVAYDVTRSCFLLVEKRLGLVSRVYELPWKPGYKNETRTARPIGTVSIPIVTGLDISPDGRRAIFVTYGNGFEFNRGSDDNWERALVTAGHAVPLPVRRQGESVCYGRDGSTLYLTSEKKPCPLFAVGRLKQPLRARVGPQARPPSN